MLIARSALDPISAETYTSLNKMYPDKRNSALKTTSYVVGAVSLGMLAIAVHASAQVPAPVLSWNFDESEGDHAAEQVRNANGLISGVYLHVPGVHGNALRLDGETSGVVVKGSALPDLAPAFTIEAWIVIDAYPWNWAPIADQRREEKAGFFFGVDSFGHLGLQAEIGGKWESATTNQQLPLKKWVQVAATFSSSTGMKLFVNGKPVESKPTSGAFASAAGEDLLIGRVRYSMLPAHWIHPEYKVWHSFDGILDELSIFNQALTPQQIATEYGKLQAPAGDVLPYPQLPSGRPGAGPFGAYSTTLKYDELWDTPRRVGRDADVVVRFDNSPVRLVAWQGTNYIPAWVTENGKWYTDEFVEAVGAADCPGGEDCEPMSDKQNRYAHVRILENTPARAVIHVRYGQCEVENDTCANPDPLTGWTDWADDYYTIYPDEVAARKTVAWSSNLKVVPEFQETIVINQAGTRPEDNIQTDALTFVNMKGETHTYSWLHPPTVIAQPEGANIQAVNLKSEWKPFQIVLPDHPLISVYQGERTWSMFEWWNHWPVAQVKSSGISAIAPDRPSHSSLSHIEGQPWQRTSNSVTKIMLDGLTNRPAAELALLARSWASPPQMTVVGGDFQNKGYDPSQRAFVLERVSVGSAPLQLHFYANADSPLLNPAIVVEKWGEAAATLLVNGKPAAWGPVAWGNDARFGLVSKLEGSTLVVWLRMKAEVDTSIELRPVPAGTQ